MKFHSLRNNLNNNTSQKESFNIKEIISKLDIIFEEKLSESFKDILIYPRNKFLDIIISQIKKFIDEQFGDDIYKNEKFINFFSSSCNNLEDKYKTYLEELNQVWEEYSSKKQNINDNSFFFTKFRKHCIKTENFAMHKCHDNNIGYYILSSKKIIKKGIGGQSSFQYLICNKCKSVFSTNKFINFCKDCNENYLSSALSHNEDPDLILATWKRPHCDCLVNEKIKCKKCKYNFLYLNTKSNRLQCKNKSCNFNETPYNIEWNCNVCNKSFYSNVKIYNPVEVQQIKDIIKLSLLLKKKAHPTNISCCKNIDVLTQNFFHKKECKGLLYFGEYNSKTIIVCEKCKAINFLAKFIWTCPLCGVRFRGKSDLCSNNTEGFNKNFLSYKSRKKIKSENNDDNNNEQKGLRSNQSYGRRNRETLVSLLRKRNEMSLEKDKNLNRNENGNKIDRKIIEKDSKTFNIKSIKYDENKENTNTNTNNLKIIQLDSIDMDKTSQYRRGLKKSLSESKSLQNTSKRNSYFGKRITNIEPIKEENDFKINSPQKKSQNNIITKTEGLTIQNEASNHKNKIIYIKNDENKKENCFSPKIKNSIYNKYLNYINFNTNSYKKENISNNEKIFLKYSRRKHEEEKKDEIKQNNNNRNNMIIYKERTLNTHTKYLENNKQNYNNEIAPNIKKEEFKDNSGKNTDKKNDKINVNKKDIKIIPINNRFSNYMKKNETNSNLNINCNNIITNYNTYKNENNKISINTFQVLDNRNKNIQNTQEKFPNKEEIPKKFDKTKILLRQNKINDLKEEPNMKNENKEQINTIKIRKIKYENNENKNKENEINEKIKTFRYRSRLKNRINEKEEKNELIENNKSKEGNKNENNKRENNLYFSVNDSRFKKRDSFRERLRNFNGKEEDINKKINERKQVKSRKEILKEKEKNNSINIQTEKVEKETNNNRNLKTLENQANKRYTHNRFFDSHQESVKTKENTISHYTKDSCISKDTNTIQTNNNSITFKNVSNTNKNDNKEINNNLYKSIREKQEFNVNEYNTEKRPFYHIKKSRKDYINDRNKKNNENLLSDKKEDTTAFILNQREKVTRTSYQPNKISNIFMNNIDINIDKEEDIPIFDKEIRKDKDKYNQLQYQLKSILVKSCLPKFNIDYYIIKNQIGAGSFSVIFQVYNIKTRCKFALKKIFAPDISSLQKFVKEFELVHQNPHNHILDLIGVCIQCVDITNYILYILMDLAEQDWNKEINFRAKYKKYYSENELINILKQLCSALYFLQKDKKIAHRDIKPENILIFKNSVYKIGDFGEAKENKIPKQFSTLRGTELYMSPLLYKGLHENKEDIKHNQFKSDMFSLGYCFVYAASLDLNIIFKIRDVNSTIILKKILLNEFGRRYSDKFVDLILKMIAYNEEKRIDFIELDKILRDEF